VLQRPDPLSTLSTLLPKLPEMLARAHGGCRRVLNRCSQPARGAGRMEPLVAPATAFELHRRTRTEGQSANLVSEFAIRFPTDMFLATLNLPVSDGEEFLVVGREDLQGPSRAQEPEGEAGYMAIKWLQGLLRPGAIRPCAREKTRGRHETGLHLAHGSCRRSTGSRSPVRKIIIDPASP